MDVNTTRSSLPTSSRRRARTRELSFIRCLRRSPPGPAARFRHILRLRFGGTVRHACPSPGGLEVATTAPDAAGRSTARWVVVVRVCEGNEGDAAPGASFSAAEPLHCTTARSHSAGGAEDDDAVVSHDCVRDSLCTALNRVPDVRAFKVHSRSERVKQRHPGNPRRADIKVVVVVVGSMMGGARGAGRGDHLPRVAAAGGHGRRPDAGCRVWRRASTTGSRWPGTPTRTTSCPSSPRRRAGASAVRASGSWTRSCRG